MTPAKWDTHPGHLAKSRINARNSSGTEENSNVHKSRISPRNSREIEKNSNTVIYTNFASTGRVSIQ